MDLPGRQSDAGVTNDEGNLSRMHRCRTHDLGGEVVRRAHPVDTVDAEVV